MKPLSQRLLLNALIILELIIIIFTCIISYQLVQQVNTAKDWVIHSVQVTNTLKDINLDAVINLTNERGYLLTGNNEYLSDYSAEITNLQQLFVQAKQLLSDNSVQLQRLQDLQALVQQRINFSNLVIQTHQQSGLNASSQLVATGKGKVLNDQIQNAIDIMNAEESLLLRQRDVELNNDIYNTNLVIMVATISGAGLLIIYFLFLNWLFRRQSSAEKSIKESQNILNGIIDGSSDPIAALDRNATYIAINHAYSKEFKKIFGKEIKVGMTIKDAFSQFPAEYEKAMLMWKKAIQGEEFTVVNEFGDPKLERNIYEISSSSIRDENKKLIGTAHVVRNVNNRVKAENELKAANEQLQTGIKNLGIRYHEISLLREMSNMLQACETINESFSLISSYCQQIFPGVAGILYILQPSKNYLEEAVNWNHPSVSEPIFPSDHCWALRQSRIYRYYYPEKEVACEHTKMTGEKSHSYICAPLLAQNEVIGLLYLEVKVPTDTKTMYSFSEKYELIISALTEQVSLSLANIRLRETLKKRSIRDPLTGLYNRAYLDETFERELTRAARNKTSLAVVMVDIDYFKAINDKLGHGAGDVVLQKLGQLFLNSVRYSDIACRYGGEEFVFVFYDTTLPSVLERVEHLRKEITNMKLNYGDVPLENITLSIGIALYPEHGDIKEQLIKIADQALYYSKEAGRNCVTVGQVAA